MSTITSTIVFYLTISSIRAFTIRNDSYKELREYLINQEMSNYLGGRIILSDNEIKANEILMKMKEQEVNYSNPSAFNFSRGFGNYKDRIRESKLYTFLKDMPKGALLHTHSTMMLNPDDLLELTYEDNLYICFSGRNMKLKFAAVQPKKHCNETWQLLSQLRQGDVREVLDLNIKKQFSIFSPQVTKCEPNRLWKLLEKVHGAIRPLVTYKPVLEKYIYKSLQRMYEDNVMYAEIRTGLRPLYLLSGKRLPRIESVRVFDKVTKQFKDSYPDFIGIKLIITAYRFKDINDIKSHLSMVIKLKKKLPHLIAGFDLVGQEDLGKTLYDYLPALHNVKRAINFYFHGGETNWSGTKVDENLFDAILLGTKRIGHGYALVKHPSLLEVVKKNDIAIEVNVISNEVLCLVKDVRNHPLAGYLAQNLPVVLSSDDAGVWGADPLTTDFFVAFLGVASKRADLKMLKQLALNSIKYSALDDHSKIKAYAIFHTRWEMFLKKTISTHDSYSKKFKSKYPRRYNM